MKIVHTADVHLRERGDERWQALEQVLTLCRSEGADLLTVGGDLFDQHTEAERLRPALRHLFSDIPFQVLLLPGNHDFAAYRGGRYFGSNTAVLEDAEKPFRLGGQCFWGFPSERGSTTEVLRRLRRLRDLCSPDERNILLFHGELLDAFHSPREYGREGTHRYMPVRLSFFSGIGLEYVLAGHFHSRFDVRTLPGEGYFVYPGSPCPHSRKEIGKRKVCLVETGEPPLERELHLPFFEERTVALDPVDQDPPEEAVRRALQNRDPLARILLTVEGFFDGERHHISEQDLAASLKELGEDIGAEVNCAFRDVGLILQDELFQAFSGKLEKRRYPTETTQALYRTALSVMAEVKSAAYAG